MLKPGENRGHKACDKGDLAVSVAWRGILAAACAVMWMSTVHARLEASRVAVRQ